MVRRVFAMGKAAELYKSLDVISYPIRPEGLLPCVPQQCRMLSYQELAEATGCEVEEIAAANKSRTGAVSFDRKTGRYLVLYNAGMNEGRVRWTKVHELGHVLLGHLGSAADRDEWGYREFEGEADYFTWNLLAPMPVLREMGVGSPGDVSRIFGLSARAGAIQFERYKKWTHHIPETGWSLRARALRAEERSIAAMEESILRSFHFKGRY